MTKKSTLTLALCLATCLLILGCATEPPVEPAGPEVGDPGEPSAEAPSPVFTYPHDGQLYAALECVPITPDEENHPSTVFLAGTSNGRPSQGVHDDLEACALLLGQDDDTLVLIALDLVGVLEARVNKMKDRLQALGVDRTRVIIASSHTHTGPDTVGIYGEDYYKTGLDYVYQEFLCDAVEEAVAAAGPAMVPVTATFATGTVNEPESTYVHLIRDSRDPQVIDDRIHGIRFDNPDTGTVATLVNFGSHPEAAICYDWISADFPLHLRERLSREYGGGALFFSGAIGGLMTPIGVSVPARDEQGNPVYEEGEPVWLRDCSWERNRSFGYYLAELVMEALDGVEPSPVDGIDVLEARFCAPITNFELWAANAIGIVEHFPMLREPGCGVLGCGTGSVFVATFGDAQITTSPGETFPETILGREEVTIDYGEPWGPWTFEAMEGLLPYYTRPMAMHFGLADNFIGYIVPECDFLPDDHPENYCEYFAVSRQGETRIRETLMELLQAQAASEQG